MVKIRVILDGPVASLGVSVVLTNSISYIMWCVSYIIRVKHMEG